MPKCLEAARTAKPPHTHALSPRPAVARVLTPVPQRRTKIDWLEKVAQTFYACSLLFAPEWWLNENFVDKSLQNNDSVLALMSIMGLLCLTINIITFVIRNAKNTRVELMKKMDYVAAAGASSSSTRSGSSRTASSRTRRTSRTSASSP